MQCCQVFELTYVIFFVLLVQYEKSVSELLFFNKPLPIISLSCTLVVLFFCSCGCFCVWSHDERDFERENELLTHHWISLGACLAQNVSQQVFSVGARRERDAEQQLGNSIYRFYHLHLAPNFPRADMWTQSLVTSEQTCKQLYMPERRVTVPSTG